MFQHNDNERESNPLPESMAVYGQPVVYTGPDSAEGIYGASATPRVLRTGHPGRIVDPTPQHIRVEWVGLENEPVSFAAGFVRERPDRPGPSGWVPGLAAISEETYVELARTVENPGLSVTTQPIGDRHDVNEVGGSSE